MRKLTVVRLIALISSSVLLLACSGGTSTVGSGTNGTGTTPPPAASGGTSGGGGTAGSETSEGGLVIANGSYARNSQTNSQPGIEVTFVLKNQSATTGYSLDTFEVETTDGKKILPKLQGSICATDALWYPSMGTTSTVRHVVLHGQSCNGKDYLADAAFVCNAVKKSPTPGFVDPEEPGSTCTPPSGVEPISSSLGTLKLTLGGLLEDGTPFKISTTAVER